MHCFPTQKFILYKTINVHAKCERATSSRSKGATEHKEKNAADCFSKLPEHIGFVALFKLGFLLGALKGWEIEFKSYTQCIKFGAHIQCISK